MNIQTVSAKSQIFANVGRYFFAELQGEKHAIALSAGPREVRVIVTSNASHKAWRRMGNGFDSYAAAIANYKTPEIRAMIEEAQRLDQAQAAQQVAA